ncbi:MAG: PhoH family protein [Sphingobacteriales bacterium]|nr:MAG: PhoH family protein [Sphingobacteriales bacterium]
MSDIHINLDDVHPIAFLGINNVNLKLIQHAFPKLKIIARGSELIVKGDEAEVKRLQEKVKRILSHINRHETLPEEKLRDILGDIGAPTQPTENAAAETKDDNNFLLIGNDGMVIKAKTPNQVKLVEACTNNDLVFAIGPAGTGKTYTSVAIAVRALKRKEVKRIIIARPAVEAGENLGFLPGDLKEKIDPYLRPVYDALDDMIPADKLKQYFEHRVIEVAPLAFMRGRTLNHAVVILDEAQNATHTQLKMFLTRMGPNAKFIITGDLTQIDLPKHGSSGLLNAIHILKGLQGISVVELTVQDVIRHRLVRSIVTAYEQFKTVE